MGPGGMALGEPAQRGPLGKQIGFRKHGKSSSPRQDHLVSVPMLSGLGEEDSCTAACLLGYDVARTITS